MRADVSLRKRFSRAPQGTRQSHGACQQPYTFLLALARPIPAIIIVSVINVLSI